jgi:hypothetical protein
MSETKWTPGPWQTEENHIVAGAVRVAVVDTPNIHGGVDWIECDYNARLIAAAPDLYAALSALLDDVGRTNSMPGAVQARAALAKARGE